MTQANIATDNQLAALGHLIRDEQRKAEYYFAKKGMSLTTEQLCTIAIETTRSFWSARKATAQ